MDRSVRTTAAFASYTVIRMRTDPLRLAVQLLF